MGKFALPILSILDEMQSKTRPDQTMLSEVVSRLYVDEGMPVHTIASLLGIGEGAVRERVPSSSKRKKRSQKEIDESMDKVRAAHAEGKSPKEIAWDYDIPLHQVYTLLRRRKT